MWSLSQPQWHGGAGPVAGTKGDLLQPRGRACATLLLLPSLAQPWDSTQQLHEHYPGSWPSEARAGGRSSRALAAFQPRRTGIGAALAPLGRFCPDSSFTSHHMLQDWVKLLKTWSVSSKPWIPQALDHCILQALDPTTPPAAAAAAQGGSPHGSKMRILQPPPGLGFPSGFHHQSLGSWGGGGAVGPGLLDLQC